jgi:hypothetical protein
VSGSCCPVHKCIAQSAMITYLPWCPSLAEAGRDARSSLVTRHNSSVNRCWISNPVSHLSSKIISKQASSPRSCAPNFRCESKSSQNPLSWKLLNPNSAGMPKVSWKHHSVVRPLTALCSQHASCYCAYCSLSPLHETMSKNTDSLCC